MKEIHTLAVIGAGTMGNGIAQCAAQANYQVFMTDTKTQFLDRGFASIKKSLSRFAAKGKISEVDAARILASIKGTLDIKEAVHAADIVIECVPEELDIKKNIFKQLDELSPKDAILATNTSNCSITAIASATMRPEKVIGIHFANPVPIMVGVEIIKGLDTSEDTLQAAQTVVKKMGKEYYLTNDSPGFSGNRMLLLYLNESFNVVMEGVSTPKDVDKNFRLSFNHPMGPFELADLIGLDQILHGLVYMRNEFGDKYIPSPLLKKLVAAGYYGVKTGRGVYKYNEKGEKI
jgi:3-hydroxybutyryl-CoA dehydrogenase